MHRWKFLLSDLLSSLLDGSCLFNYFHILLLLTVNSSPIFDLNHIHRLVYLLLLRVLLLSRDLLLSLAPAPSLIVLPVHILFIALRRLLIECGRHERALRPALLLLGLREAHGLRLVVADVVLVVLDLLELSQFVGLLLLNLFDLLLILGRPHLVRKGVRLVHDGHLTLELEVELVAILEEGVVGVRVVPTIKVHVVEAVRVLLLEQFVNNPPGNFLPEHVLFLVQILHLLLFPDLLKLGPKNS